MRRNLNIHKATDSDGATIYRVLDSEGDQQGMFRSYDRAVEYAGGKSASELLESAEQLTLEIDKPTIYCPITHLLIVQYLFERHFCLCPGFYGNIEYYASLVKGRGELR